MEKTVKFKNHEVEKVKSFLDALKLKGKASRGRSKLCRLLTEKLFDYQADIDELKKKYFITDNGEYVKREVNGKSYFVFKDKNEQPEFDSEYTDIMNDLAIITVEEYLDKIKALYEALNDYDGTFSKEDALVYDTLMDELDKIFENEASEA